MRILVTNDDGVEAPGLAALAAGAAGAGHQVIVVAPDQNYSGASAAVGPVHEREGVAYERRTLDGLRLTSTDLQLEGIDVGLLDYIDAFAIDGPPALAVILAGIGAFGPPPEMVLSGINHGANVGRSALHSGTVGAALTAAQLGVSALAVSIVYSEDPPPWGTPAHLGASLLDHLAAAPVPTVWNLNVPSLPLAKLSGARRGRLGRAGTIRSAVHHGPSHTHDGAHIPLELGPSGMLRLDLAIPAPSASADADTDAGLLYDGYVSLTALVGVHEADPPEAPELSMGLSTLESILS